jgi:hypothetical protein
VNLATFRRASTEGKSRRVTRVAVGLILIVFGPVLWWAGQPREPVYEGKSVRKWLADYRYRMPAGSFSFDVDQDALRGIGPYPIDGRPLRGFHTTGQVGTNRTGPPLIVFNPRRTGEQIVIENKGYQALREMGPDAIPVLTRELRRREYPAGRIFRRVTGNGPKWLREFLPAPETRLQINAAYALATLAPRDVAVQELTRALEHPNPEVRAAVAATLGSLGSLAKRWAAGTGRTNLAVRDLRDIERALIAALQDQSPRVADRALLGLLGLGSTALETLAAMTTFANHGTNIQAQSEVERYLNSRDSSVELIAAVLESSRPAVVQRALRALGYRGAQAAAAVPAIVPLLQDPDRETRYVAINTLGEIGVVTEEAMVALEAALTDETTIVRNAARRVLNQIAPERIGPAKEP